MGTKVMKDCLEGTPHCECLVAAYLAGGNVPRDLFGSVFKQIHEMSGPSDVNCIASWDTRIKESFHENSVHKMGFGMGMWYHHMYWLLHDKCCEKPEGMDDQSKARVETNPLTWSSEPGGRFLGAKRIGDSEPVPGPEGFGDHVTVSDHAVWVEDPRCWYYAAAKSGNLHPVDIQFWFFNIRENVSRRLKAWSSRNWLSGPRGSASMNPCGAFFL